MARFLLLVSLLAVSSVVLASKSKGPGPKPKGPGPRPEAPPPKPEVPPPPPPTDCSVRERAEDPTSLVRSGLGPFTYDDGPTGPSNWGNINCPGYDTCSSGKLQSPINIEATHYWKPGCRLNLQIESPVAALMNYSVAANDFSLQCADKFWGCGDMRYRGRLYSLLQIHLHSPSEHTIDGKREPMEIHFVHRDPMDKKSLAVLGAFIRVGEFNPHLEALFLAARSKGSQYVSLKSLLAPVEANPRPCTFIGSLTTPPCSEGVKWILSNTPLHASRDQIVAFQGMNNYMPNNRPRQSAQGRSIRCFREGHVKNDSRPFCTNEHY